MSSQTTMITSQRNAALRGKRSPFAVIFVAEKGINQLPCRHTPVLAYGYEWNLDDNTQTGSVLM